MIFLKLNSPWDTVPSHLNQGLYVGGPHDVVFRSELDFESERGAVTWGEIRTVLAHQGVRSPRPSEPPRSGCWPSPDPLPSLPRFILRNRSDLHDCRERPSRGPAAGAHSPASRVGCPPLLQQGPAESPLHAAGVVIFTVVHKTNFYRSVALCPQRQAAREKGHCLFTPGPGTYYVPQI